MSPSVGHYRGPSMTESTSSSSPSVWDNFLPASTTRSVPARLPEPPRSPGIVRSLAPAPASETQPLGLDSPDCFPVAQNRDPYASPPFFPHGAWKQDAEGSPYINSWVSEEQDGLEERALKDLIHLSIFCPFVALIFCVFAIFVGIISCLMAPFRLCAAVRTYQETLIGLLAAAVRYQLRLISPPLRDPRCGSSTCSPSAWKLVIVHLASPLVASCIAVAAWLAALFWLFAAIIGNPDGRDGKDDGRAAVLTVAKWWKNYLKCANG